MYPTEERINELRERFGVSNGQFFGTYRFKNLNWYYTDDKSTPIEDQEWFCYGDIRDEHIPVLQNILNPEEQLTLGWKDLGPDIREDRFFGSGNDAWLIIRHDEVPFDIRRDTVGLNG